jgi:hypothetical protein
MEDLLGFIIIVVLLFGICAIIGTLVIPINFSEIRTDVVIVVVYVITLIVFVLKLTGHQHSYKEAIDPVDNGYTPFSKAHILTLVVYFILYNMSMLLIWRRGIKLPPIVLTLLLTFIVLGLIINVSIISQVSSHNEVIEGYENKGEALFLTPLISFILGIIILFKVMLQKSEEAAQITYSNKVLNSINEFLSHRYRQPFIVLLLLLPVFLIITLILTLWGQEPDSIIKVFTDTTTWRHSQQMHPPYLEHHEHYLCTIAVYGDPEIVKPLRFGKRGGRRIIVNRQLLIANAFEELIQKFSPTLHRFIRTNYDKYGYNLSKKINTPKLSNLTYILMKPLEWFFLFCLYLCYTKPEEHINRQYAE